MEESIAMRRKPLNLQFIGVEHVTGEKRIKGRGTINPIRQVSLTFEELEKDNAL